MRRRDQAGYGDVSGKPIPASTLAACVEEVQRCDAILLAGTSGAVNPAAQFPLVAREHGAQIIEVNPMPTELTSAAHVVITGPAGTVLPALARGQSNKPYESDYLIWAA